MVAMQARAIQVMALALSVSNAMSTSPSRLAVSRPYCQTSVPGMLKGTVSQRKTRKMLTTKSRCSRARMGGRLAARSSTAAASPLAACGTLAATASVQEKATATRTRSRGSSACIQVRPLAKGSENCMFSLSQKRGDTASWMTLPPGLAWERIFIGFSGFSSRQKCRTARKSSRCRPQFPRNRALLHGSQPAGLRVETESGRVYSPGPGRWRAPVLPC